MLLKQFLNDNEHNDLLNLLNTINFTLNAVGKSAKYYYVKDVKNKTLNIIIDKSHQLLLKQDKNYKHDLNASVFIKITNYGWINCHTDLTKENTPYTNINILLKKANEGGLIIHGNKKIIMQEKDLFILDGEINHGVSRLKSNDKYYSLVLWFYK